MPTFIDESGDTGLVQERSKPYFRLAAVWVPTLDDAEMFREKVRLLRREHGLRIDYEFKFADTYHRPRWREAFFNTALTQEFRFAVSLIDKTHADWSAASSSQQHWACATELAALLRPIYCRAEVERAASFKEPIVVDKNEDGKFLAVVKRQFRGLRSPSRPGSSLIGKVTFRNSVPDEMIQLADMVCGAVGALIDHDDRTWYGLIAERDVETRHLT